MNRGFGYFGYYALFLFATYAFRYPPLLVGVVVFFLLRRFIPDPFILMRTLGRMGGLKRAIESNPANVTARRDLAIIYLQQRRPSAALEKIEEGLKRFPADAELLFLKGAALHAKGEFEQATGPLVRAVQADPRMRFGEPYLLAGDCLFALGRFDESIDAYDRLLSVNSSSIEGRVKKARAHAKANEGEAAKRDLDEALSTWRQIPSFQKRTQFTWWLRAQISRWFV